MPETVPYGAWASPITPDLLASSGTPLLAVALDGDTAYWLERRPTEGGRSVLVQAVDGRARVLTPGELDVRTLVHEYGGGDFAVRDGCIVFANFADQRVYRQDGGTRPVAITPDPAVERGDRYADFDIGPDGRVYAVRERHTPGGSEPTNDVVSFPLDGSADPVVVASGGDFYAAPRISPDGTRLAWMTWDHPRMPWDGATLWIADLAGGDIRNAREVAGGEAEAVCAPAWSPAGGSDDAGGEWRPSSRLHFVNDPSGWWNLFRLDEREADTGRSVTQLTFETAELAGPHWRFGATPYAFLADGRIACIVNARGTEHLALLSPDGELTDAGLPYTAFVPMALAGSGSRVAFVAGTPTSPPEVVVWDADRGTVEVVKRSLDVELDPAGVSVPDAIEFPTDDGLRAHAWFYRPTHADTEGPPAERPPLLVVSHGGPTSQSPALLSLSIQFWTSRGFAVADVNYGGSTGYGRDYRERLDGRWGIIDTRDCLNAARWLADRQLVDARRMAIRGGSAGGYTTLCALVFHDLFSAGVSYFGVADPALLAQETHKFESRYLDRLIGPWPQAEARYRERSPLHHADRLSCPLLLLQGAEDAVVPPAQAERMVAALEATGVPYAYVLFPGEQHGFRQASSIVRAATAELSFYGQVFGFTPAGEIEPVTVHNG